MESDSLYNSPIPQEEKDLILKYHSEGCDCREISKRLNGTRTSKAINKFLHRRGLNTSHSIYRKITENEKNDICSRYLNGETGAEIHGLYKDKIDCENTIIKIIRDNGIKIRKAIRYTKIKHEDFFRTIDSEEKAYIIGWLITDGYVVYPQRTDRKNNVPSWGITLKSTDGYMLERIRDIIGVDKKICYQDRGDTQECVFIVTSEQMVKDLSKYGIVQRKSATVRLPNLDESLMPHLLRGIFDGDGSIFNRTCTYSGNFNMMSDISSFFKSMEIFQNKMYVGPPHPITNYSMCRIAIHSKKDVIKFYDYLYNNATIYLERKYNKFQELDYINSLLQKDVDAVVT